MLFVNEHAVPFPRDRTLTIGELASLHKPGADIFIRNGHPVDPETLLEDGDHCSLIRRGEIPPPDELEFLLASRHTPGIHARIKKGCIGILGLGGLGSTVAGAMAKIGIGKMLISDYDRVEPSNLNRQHYFIDQIGMMKTRALKDNLLRMNPSLSLQLIEKRLREADLADLFGQVDVLVECFDDPAMKAATLRSVLTQMPGVAYVGSSGMAGYGENNQIRTRMVRPGIYIVGDETSAAQPGQGLMAPRVGIAAHHQANQALRLLLGVDPGRLSDQ